jgi:hypothetical protein
MLAGARRLFPQTGDCVADESGAHSFDLAFDRDCDADGFQNTDGLTFGA